MWWFYQITLQEPCGNQTQNTESKKIKLITDYLLTKWKPEQTTTTNFENEEISDE